MMRFSAFLTLRVTLEPRAPQYFQQRCKLRLLFGVEGGKNRRFVAAVLTHFFTLVFGNLTANGQLPDQGMFASRFYISPPNICQKTEKNLASISACQAYGQYV